MIMKKMVKLDNGNKGSRSIPREMVEGVKVIWRGVKTLRKNAGREKIRRLCLGLRIV